MGFYLGPFFSREILSSRPYLFGNDDRNALMYGADFCHDNQKIERTEILLNLKTK